MARVYKTIEYRRAIWFSDEASLEELLQRAWDSLESQTERTLERPDGVSVVGLRGRHIPGVGFAFHCAKYVDRRAIGTVPMEPAAAVSLGEKAPEVGENFLDSDLMALVSENHVITLNAGLNAATLRHFVWGLFENAEFGEACSHFDLARIGNLDRVAMIEAAGVAEVELNISISEASAMTMAEAGEGGGWWSRVKSELANQLQAIIARDEEVDQLGLAERGTMSLSIKVPKGDLAAANRGLTSFAEAVAEEEEADNFIIRLRNGQTIKPSEVAVRKRVRSTRWQILSA